MPIFDQGYQHWQGKLSGHTWRALAVTRHGVRALLQNRFVRLLLVLAYLPAVALVAWLAVWGLLEQKAESVLTFLQRLLPTHLIDQPQDYRSAVWTVAYSFFFKAELVVSLFLVLIVGPNLISRDLRFNALPLYFSRPLGRLDYFLGKLGVIGFFLAAVVIVPAAVAYLLGLAFSLDVKVVRDTHRLLWGGTLYGLVIIVSAGTVMLALSSLSRRSLYVGLAWAGFVFLSWMIATAMVGIESDRKRWEKVEVGMRKWVSAHPPPPGVRMYGWHPGFSTPFGPGGQPVMTDEEKARQRWFTEWTMAEMALRDEAAFELAEESKTDWRPVLSFATNLDRLGDALLDTDTAWVVLGRAVERPRAMIAPMMGGRGGPIPGGPVNDRRLADAMVKQYPWYWSAGALAGLSLISAWVLSRRVKSLDRLK